LKIVHTVSSLLGGGMEHFVLRIAEAQQKRGHEVTIVALRGGPLEEHAHKMGLRLVVLGGSLPSRLLKAMWTMARLRPDVTNAHNPTSLQYALFGKVLGGSKLIMTDHAATRGVVRVPGPLERRKTDAVVCVSEDTKRRAGDHGIVQNLMVIHNGIEMKPAVRSRQAVREELGLPEDRIVGSMVAAFDPVKGHDVLLKALAKVRDERVSANDGRPAITLLVLGDGAERAKIEALASSLGLGPDDVRLLGFRADVPDILGASDFFTLPSRMEGLPLAVLEAMSHRLPVVVTPVGGVPELVEDGEHGFIVPVDDPDALASAFERVAADPVFRREAGEAGHQLVKDRFTFAEMSLKYEQLYYELCTKGRPTGT
jgi:glycosyltransferase involved in cell wall biosynthesis